MKPYVMTTGFLFALLTVLHIWRMFQEPSMVRDPWYWLITAASTALAFWAWRVVRVSARS